MVRLPTLLLYKKEIQQNAILYFLPAPFAIALIYLKILGEAFPAWMGSVLGLAVPFTLAVAYGLQGFDVEEDAQTRDFLLAKPLSLSRIVGEKFILGLGILLCWVAISIWGATAFLSWPSIFNIYSWIPGLVILGSIIVYSASFFTGLWISGPKKLLAASAVSLIGLCWGFFIFSSMATFIVHVDALASMPFVQEFLLYLTGIIIVATFVFLHVTLAIWYLLQRPQLNEYARLGQSIGLAVFIPVFTVVLNFAAQPSLRSSYFYGFELLGLETPFWVYDGAWHPSGNQIALIGDHNQIGLARLGEKPRLIFSGPKEKKDSLKDLSWSPDGKRLAYVLKNQIYYMDIKDKKPIWIGEGFSPCWSRRSDAILFARENIAPQKKRTPMGEITIHTVDFYKADFRTYRVEPKLRIQSLDTYWTWDSIRDIVYFTDPYGGIHVYTGDKIVDIALPSFPRGREIAFWSRYYSNTKNPNQMLLSLFSMSTGDKARHKCNYRIYRIDLIKKQSTLVSQRLQVDLANLILEPNSGTALWSHGSTYKKDNVYTTKEVKP